MESKAEMLHQSPRIRSQHAWPWRPARKLFHSPAVLSPKKHWSEPLKSTVQLRLRELMFLAAGALRSSKGSRVHCPIPEWPAVRFFAPRTATGIQANSVRISSADNRTFAYPSPPRSTNSFRRLPGFIIRSARSTPAVTSGVGRPRSALAARMRRLIAGNSISNLRVLQGDAKLRQVVSNPINKALAINEEELPREG